MHRCLIAAAGLAVLLSSPEARAQARPDTRSMTCAQAQAFVQQRGAVVMSTGQYTYDRFVASRAFCMRDEILKPLYAPTRDTAQCPVAYECRQIFRPTH
ncbi:hypothetical protein GR183_12935 [Stappia sp. GBMRC 2046]|uniref:Uncharacterized protein n=1 Tax=Stappia sediminis TaxID=2692190 RepID=A0A7X3LVI9_9HYPH|nr:hypothetical protein [Stappia sediminis]MXN65812.1 hypothetical protein [Stappia sediminis]